MPRPIPPSLVPWTIFVLFAGSSFAQEPCLDCHEVELASDLHQECSGCHWDVDVDEHFDVAPILDPNEVCGACHDPSEGLLEGPHAEISCLDCHGPAHGILSPSELESPMSPVNQIQVCGGCHDQPEELLPNYLASVHGRALLVSGLINAPSCSDCHGSHDIFPADDERAALHERSVPTTCGSCHALLLDTWEHESRHGQIWAATIAGEGPTDQKAPVCSTCHPSHEITDPTRPGVRLAFPENCGECHPEFYTTFRDSFHGKASDLGFSVTAICSDCHTPHASLPADDPRSSVHADNLQATCGACHGEVSAAFASFEPHAHPSDPDADPLIYFVWLSMTSLLIGVFAFFGLHDLLWLQRAVVALRRGEVHRHDPTVGPWIRRFGRTEQRIHLVVISSFLLLAATGLPLHFHHVPWARVVADLFGGVGTTKVLHRLAAIATFGYFFFHVFTLGRRAAAKEPGLFWGWRSMVPQVKDARDMWANLKYFLYRGRQPALDRWSYWEKFDYFAVFWGVVIIGTSGLFLWFPKVVTTVLPGWVLNVAAIVHGDEALLATGFIFLFHFFHTHLRPEAFPLDPVIFLGGMPLERFKEERPLEHRRLVESGKLETLLMDPPTPAEFRRARWVGTTAVLIGLTIFVGIVWGLLAH